MVLPGPTQIDIMWQVLKMEGEVLNLLNFQLSVPTTKTFLRYLGTIRSFFFETPVSMPCNIVVLKGTSSQEICAGSTGFLQGIWGDGCTSVIAKE